MDTVLETVPAGSCECFGVLHFVLEGRGIFVQCFGGAWHFVQCFGGAWHFCAVFWRGVAFLEELLSLFLGGGGTFAVFWRGACSLEGVLVEFWRDSVFLDGCLSELTMLGVGYDRRGLMHLVKSAMCKYLFCFCADMSHLRQRPDLKQLQLQLLRAARQLEEGPDSKYCVSS